MNKVWAISDIHLPGTTRKTMEKYGDIWKNHPAIILENVKKLCDKNDILLIPGDISWAPNLDRAKKDLEYLGSFPCHIILCSGNHDRWAATLPRDELVKVLPSNITWIHDVCFRIGNLAIVGSCFWEFRNVFPWPDHVGIIENLAKHQKEELKRFEKALKLVPDDANLIKILMLHVPPIPYDASPYTFSTQISEKNIDYCVFGHAHNVVEKVPACDAIIKGTHYFLCSADFLKMTPIHICDFDNDSQPYIIDEKGKITPLNIL
ncbi:metallophosphoesterase [Tritrichomonas foetus]|uniref:Metallophosphoesterase n=1 Tax=Tritrichomonas foetus TaxID=1144522 RepID=A0A1J4J6F5_9EUKA|nr:metallophosphoesterase [Tritrichomonas foetus]|eukprot:OHS93251.1 metallophosphoesterase [Tritrichomonas foetus]